MAITSLKYKTKLGTLTAPGDVDPGAMIPIQTVTVGAGGASTIAFNNIPSTYEHLHIRGILRDAEDGYGGQTYVNLNGVTSGIPTHYMYGQGAVAAGGNLTGSSVIWVGTQPANLGNASLFGAFIIDILDYSNLNKNKTLKVISGWDNNGAASGQNGGQVWLGSGLFLSTSAVTSVSIRSNGTLNQHSSFALYGIKRAGA